MIEARSVLNLAKEMNVVVVNGILRLHELQNLGHNIAVIGDDIHDSIGSNSLVNLAKQQLLQRRYCRHVMCWRLRDKRVWRARCIIRCKLRIVVCVEQKSIVDRDHNVNRYIDT